MQLMLMMLVHAADSGGKHSWWPLCAATEVRQLVFVMLAHLMDSGAGKSR